MKEDLTSRLLANPAITALVAQRINWGVRPQGDPLPGFTLLKVSPGRTYTHSGAVGLAGARVQIDSWGADALSVERMARAMTAALEQPQTVGSTKFGMSFLDDETDSTPTELGGGKKVWRIRQDFIIWHEPA